MPAVYRYVGPSELAEFGPEPPVRVRVDRPQDVKRWLRESSQSLDGANRAVATFVIDTDAQLWIADRHSEHVQCARGQPVLSAGEMTFGLDGDRVEVMEVANQSTGYCPEPESWPAVATALEQAGLRGPPGFTSEFLFRRCPDCRTISLVKGRGGSSARGVGARSRTPGTATFRPEGTSMGWVKDALKELAEGRPAQVRPFGGSMRGRIESGQLVTIATVDPAEVRVDDVVFVQWQGNYLLHLVKEIKDGQILIGNNVGKINGWVPAGAVKGKVIAVCD